MCMELIITTNKKISYSTSRLDRNKALDRKEFQLPPLESWAWVEDTFYKFLYYFRIRILCKQAKGRLKHLKF